MSRSQPPNPYLGLTRRELLRRAGALTLGGAAASALSGCGSPLATGLVGAGEPADKLTYWNLFSGGDGDRMVEMEKGYERANPQISLSAVTLAWGNPYYTKLSLATRGNKPPDVAVAPPDPDDHTRAGRTPGADRRGPVGQARDAREQVQPKGLERLPRGRQAVRDPARLAPLRLVLQHRRLQEGRPPQQGRHA